ncbi:hypothetical protein VB636_00495, partial [Paracoccus sp. APAP_BH8]
MLDSRGGGGGGGRDDGYGGGGYGGGGYGGGSAGDNTAFGRVAGEYFKENLEPGAKVVVLRGIPTTLDNERVDAFVIPG